MKPDRARRPAPRLRVAAARLVAAVRAPIAVPGGTVAVGVTIGVAHAGPDADRDTRVGQADAACTRQAGTPEPDRTGVRHLTVPPDAMLLRCVAMKTFTRRTPLVGGSLGATTVALPRPAAAAPWADRGCDRPALLRDSRPDPRTAADRLLADGPSIPLLPGTPTDGKV